MSDWRQGDSGKPKSKPTKAPKAKKALPQLSPPPTGGWKGRGAERAGRSAGPVVTSSRSWTGSAIAGEAVSGSTLRRWIAVIVLLIAAIVLTAGLVIVSFRKPDKLPLFVFSVGECTASELLENSYGNSQRAKLAAINTVNVNYATSEKDGNDNALSDLATVSWIDNFDQLRSQTIAGGGPDGKIAAFYISTFAAFDSDNNLMLYHQGVSPFDADRQAKPGLKLESVLESLAKPVKRGDYAWVILDLQLPSVVANLGDLDPPWETAGMQALAKLDNDLQQRLLITLPGQDGQQNWLAPEFAGSFFGHHFRQLLEGRSAERNLLSKNLTIGRFKQLLNERVGRDVGNRRYAVQQPVWLPTASVDRAANINAVTMGDEQAFEQPQPNVVLGHWGEIDQLWRNLQLSTYQAPYRWDPLGYAMVESQLLGLEDVVLNQPEQFMKARELVVRAIRNLNLHQPPVEFEVSLIENQQRDRYFRAGRSVYALVLEHAKDLSRGLSTSPEGGPSFWRQPPADKKEAEARELNPTVEEKLTAVEKSHLVWQFYLECARSNDFKIWETAFQSERLSSALAFADQDPRSWIELYLLRRLVEDIDWSSTDQDKRPEACAQAILIFDRLQRVAAQPDPEVSWWWLREGGASILQPIETQYLRAFDQCLAGKFVDALGEFAQVDARLKPVEQKMATLQTAIDSAHEALHALPHLLAWSLKEYQFAPERELATVQTQLRNMARVADLTHQVYEYLANRPADVLDEGLVTASGELQTGLAALKLAFANYVESETSSREAGGAIVNPLPFRRGRIALLSPLLQLESRVRLHENTLPFLQMELSGGNIDGQVTQERPATQGADIFLSALQEQAEKWRPLVQGDVRSLLEQQFSQTPPATNSPLQLRSELLKEEYWHRLYAAAFGHFPSLHARLANEVQAVGASQAEATRWPWSGPWQRWNLAAANDRVFQVERLAAAGWGDSQFDEQSLPESFYFCQLAALTRLPTGFTTLEPARQFAEAFQSAMQSAVDRSVGRLKSLRAQFGEADQIVASAGEQRAPVRVAGELMEGFAQVFLGAPNNRLVWNQGDAERAWAVDLSEPDARTTNKTFDASYWQSNPPIGTLLFRGNVRSAPIDWRVDEHKQESIELSLVQTPAEDTIIRIQSPEVPPITVLMLIDCSKSMDTEIEYLKEGQKVTGPLLELVKDSALGVLEKFAEIHNQEEARVRVAMMPFGLYSRDLDGELRKVLNVGQDNVYGPKTINELDGNWQADLEANIRRLTASGDTPLYNSIVLATQQARANEKTLVYVFTDGVNFLDNGQISKSQADVRQAVQQNPHIRLSIFHFHYFTKWVEATNAAGQKVFDTEVRNLWKIKFAEGMKEMEELRSLGEQQYGYYRSDEGTKLMQESLDSIPRSKVSIVSLNKNGAVFESGPRSLGEEIRVPPEFLPAELKVAVDRPFNSPAIIHVQVLGGEKLSLPFNSQGRFEFRNFESGGKIREGEGRRVGGNLHSRLYVDKLQDRVEHFQELGFQLHFSNESRSEFTQRPAFVVAEISRSGDNVVQPYVLADHRFKVATHYPEVILSDVPWPDARQAAKLRVWAADSVPSQVMQRSLQSEQAQPPINLGIATVELSVGDQLVADVSYAKPPAPQDRVVVICPDFVSAKRSFDQNTHAERHVFTLVENAKQRGVQVQLATIGQLEEAARSNELTQFDFDQIRVDD